MPGARSARRGAQLIIVDLNNAAHIRQFALDCTLHDVFNAAAEIAGTADIWLTSNGKHLAGDIGDETVELLPQDSVIRCHARLRAGAPAKRTHTH